MTNEEIVALAKKYEADIANQPIDNSFEFGFYVGAKEQQRFDQAERDKLDARMYGINMKILEKKRKEWIDEAWGWFFDILPDTILDIPKCKEMFYSDMNKQK